MSNSEFLSHCRQERAEKLTEINDTRAQLIPAEEAQAAALLEYQTHQESSHGWGTSDTRGSMLERADYDARNIAEGIKRKIERAEVRIKELDRLLNAENDADVERTALTNSCVAITETEAELARFEHVASTYEHEKDELAARRASVIAEHAKLDLGARLAGKTAPRLKGTAEIDADIESRDAALSATRIVIGELNDKLQRLIDERTAIQRRLKRALARTAELPYYEGLPTLLPRLALLIAHGSYIGGTDRDVFTIRVPDEMLREASARIDAELAGTATASEAA